MLTKYENIRGFFFPKISPEIRIPWYSDILTHNHYFLKNTLSTVYSLFFKLFLMGFPVISWENQKGEIFLIQKFPRTRFVRLFFYFVSSIMDFFSPFAGNLLRSGDVRGFSSMARMYTRLAAMPKKGWLPCWRKGDHHFNQMCGAVLTAVYLKLNHFNMSNLNVTSDVKHDFQHDPSWLEEINHPLLWVVTLFSHHPVRCLVLFPIVWIWLALFLINHQKLDGQEWNTARSSHRWRNDPRGAYFCLIHSVHLVPPPLPHLIGTRPNFVPTEVIKFIWIDWSTSKKEI